MANPKTRAPESTLQENKFLHGLADKKKKVSVKLENNEMVSGFVEFFDATFIRLTRPGEANLFIYKHDIKYLFEETE